METVFTAAKKIKIQCSVSVSEQIYKYMFMNYIFVCFWQLRNPDNAFSVYPTEFLKSFRCLKVIELSICSFKRHKYVCLTSTNQTADILTKVHFSSTSILIITSILL